MLKKLAFLLVVVMGLTLLAGVAVAADKSYTWKIAHIRPQGSTIDKELKKFSEDMKAATGGRVTASVILNLNEVVTRP